MSENKAPMFEKCSSERMCTWLADRAESMNHSGKGFVPIYTLNSQTKTSVFYGVKYRQARGDNGIIINHCPFCGQTPGKFAEEMKR